MKRPITSSQLAMVFCPVILWAFLAKEKGWPVKRWIGDALFCLDKRNDVMERNARLHAGLGAVDCGEADVATLSNDELETIADIDGCVLRSFKKGRAVRVKYLHPLSLNYIEIRAWHPKRGLMIVETGAHPSEYICKKAEIGVGDVELPKNRHTSHLTIDCPSSACCFVQARLPFIDKMIKE